MSDPPWRLDPLQTILRVHFETKKKDKDKGQGNDSDDEKKPGKCPGCGISACGFTLCATCYCPGIFCIGSGGCCIPNGCTFAGLDIVPISQSTCFSGAWVMEQYFNCCTSNHNNPCKDMPPFSGGANYYPPGSTPSFATS